MHAVGGLSSNTVPKRFSGKAVVVSWNYPPPDSLRRAHRGERLSPDPIRGRLAIEEIAGDEHMVGSMLPRGSGQTVDRCMTGLHKTTANVFGESAEPAPQVKVGRMDEAKLGHSSQTPELQDQVHSGWNIRDGHGEGDGRLTKSRLIIWRARRSSTSGNRRTTCCCTTRTAAVVSTGWRIVLADWSALCFNVWWVSLQGGNVTFMRKIGDSFEFSATDLVGYLNCRHLSGLDRAVAEGALARPDVWDPLLQLLWERGSIHEQNYVEHLTKTGLEVVRIDGVDVTDEAVPKTLAAMKSGTPVIVQAALSYDGWAGRADILRRVEIPSALGDWSYEVIDTKLARETKAGRFCSFASIPTC